MGNLNPGKKLPVKQATDGSELKVTYDPALFEQVYLSLRKVDYLPK